MYKGKIRTGFFITPRGVRTKTHLVRKGLPLCKKKPYPQGTEFKEIANDLRIDIADCLRCLGKEWIEWSKKN